jgi:hypothetical protein
VPRGASVGATSPRDDGFMTEFRELWRGTELLAMNQQTMALIR